MLSGERTVEPHSRKISVIASEDRGVRFAESNVDIV
jgi:hypothetical protein